MDARPASLVSTTFSSLRSSRTPSPLPPISDPSSPPSRQPSRADCRSPPVSHRTSISIQPDDDPFAPAGEETGYWTERAVEPDLERHGEAADSSWMRVSEEFGGQDERESTDWTQQVPDARAIKRSPSFLRSLWNKTRHSTTSRTISTARLRSHSAASSTRSGLRSSTSFEVIKKPRISGPIVRPDQAPPRTGPLRERAELVSVGDVTGTLSLYAAKTTNEPSTWRGGGDSRRDSHAHRDSTYPSGSQSMRVKATSNRVSILDPVDGDARPLVNSRSVSRASSYGDLGRIVDENRAPTRSKKALSILGLESIVPRSVSTASSYGDLYGSIDDRLPTRSRKALSILGFPNDVTSDDQKHVERLSGLRSSVYDTEQELGLALTDVTRYVTPDNRLSLASGYSTDSISANTSNRSTLYSTPSFSRPLPPTPEVKTTSSIETSPTTASSDVAHPDRGSAPLDGFKVNASRPLSPPPSCPLPPLPLDIPQNEPRERRVSFVPTEGRRSADVVPMGKPNPAPAAAVPLDERPAKRPTILSRVYQARRRRALSFDGLGSTPVSRPGMARFRSVENLQPVSSATSIKGPRSPLSSSRTPSDPVASLYVVSGLNKDPSLWALSNEHGTDPGECPQHVDNAVPRFWRPEVLGCASSGEGETTNTAAVDAMGGELRTLTKTEVTLIQNKVVKLAFNRDVEIISARGPPPATTSFFSFSIKTPKSKRNSAFPDSLDLTTGSALSPLSTALYAVSLVVYSPADSQRSEAIRKSLARHATNEGHVMGRRSVVGEEANKSGATPEGFRRSNGERRADEHRPVDGSVNGAERDGRPADEPESYWLPYCLTLVSTSPLYNLLSDALRVSWARYYQNLSLHTAQMHHVLNTALPRPGERVSLEISVLDPNQIKAAFVATVPGSLDWSTGCRLHHDFPTWPLFQCLHSDNVITTAELALAPLGRVLFVSQHPIMLSIATATFQLVLEKRGWRGLVLPAVHVRDLQIYLEDPGPWLIAVPSPSRSIAFASLPPEIVVVDLDANFVTCAKPSQTSISTGATRERARKRLEAAIGNVGRAFSVPRDVVEAFPHGKFRPLSEVEVADRDREADRLVPDLGWNWDETRVLNTFDSILSELPKTGVVSRLFSSKKHRKIVGVDQTAAQIQEIVRKHAATFVDQRDMLESKMSRLHFKLANIKTESEEWQSSLELFRELSEKLSLESSSLSAQLEAERREAEQLVSVAEAERIRQLELESHLEETEHARQQAMAELAVVEDAHQKLTEQKSAILREMGVLLDVTDDSNPLLRSVLEAVQSQSRLIRTKSASTRRFDGSLVPPRSASSLGFHRTIVEEDAELETIEEDTEDANLEAIKLGAKEAFAAISKKLSLALQSAGSLEPAGAKSPSNDTMPTALDDEPTPLTPTPHRSSPTLDLASRATKRASTGFQPRPLTLTPPVSPELDDGNSHQPFVTTRNHRRVPSKPHSLSHSRSASGMTAFDPHDSDSTTSTGTVVERPGRQSVALSRESSTSHRHTASTGSQGSESGYSSYDDARSFVSVSEGRAAESVVDSSRPLSPTRRDSGSFDLEELAWTTEDAEIARVDHDERPPLRRGLHSRQDSFGLDAPPVELFTRSGSLRGRSRPAAETRGSIDLDARMKPSEVKASGRWETAAVVARSRPTSALYEK
ncbi:hypothetical protein JCM10212_003589 [Sporobolomyces blumeae]